VRNSTSSLLVLQLGASKEQEVVRAEAGQGAGERVLQKGPEVLRPKYQDVAFSNGGNPKNNKACPKLAENSKPPSGGTITNDRCLSHIRDGAHSESTGKCNSIKRSLIARKCIH